MTLERGKIVGLKFRKKPVVIEAYQMTRERVVSGGADGTEWPEWLKEALIKPASEVNSVHISSVSAIDDSKGPSVLWVDIYIRTLEGQLMVSINDYIVKGIRGELYPCKPDIFEETYEPVDS